MFDEIQSVSQYLLQHNIKPSYPRIRVYNYLLARTHPNVDEIHQELSQEIPSLSKTTVYSSLNLMVKKKLIRAINIEENETRYDVNTEFHGHFKCIDCGMIFDFPFKAETDEVDTLAGFMVEDKNIYFKGLCPKCNPQIS